MKLAERRVVRQSDTLVQDLTLEPCKASRVSQAVFARLLNTSLSTVQKWEIGQKKPTGTALKLLRLVEKRGLEVVV